MRIIKKFLPVFVIITSVFLPADVSAQETREAVSMPVLMYHGVLSNPDKVGDYIISAEMLETDLSFLRASGYTAVVTEDLTDYTERGIPLPDKPVMLTFDDGNYNNVYYGQPLLEKYGMKAVMFVIGQYCNQAEIENDENPEYSYMTWERVREAAESGVWDIQSHTWNMHLLDGEHRGVNKIHGESDYDYRTALYKDFMEITGKIYHTTGHIPVSFAYPFGFITEEAEEVLRDLGYKVTFSCTSGIAEVSDSESLYNIKRLTRFHYKTAEELISAYADSS